MSRSTRMGFLISSLVMPLLVVTLLLYGQRIAAQAGDMTSASPVQEQAPPIVSTKPEINASVAITTYTYLPTVQNNSSGKYVSVLVPGGQAMAAQLWEATKDFSSQTGHTVIFEGVDDFEPAIIERALSGQAPDLAFFPQPGLLGDLVATGYTIDLNQWLTSSYLQQQYAKSWLDMATINGQMAGVWYKADVKSLVWYPKAEFDAAGYSIPKDWDALIALSNQIVLDGSNPWCLGIESGAASGWVGTDWIEDILLRTTTPANYDAWVKGDLPFSSGVVSNAFQIMAGIWFTDDYVLGGRPGIQDTFFGAAPLPMFEDPPQCWLHRQANFIRGFFPEGVEVGVDVDYFVLPSIDPAYDDPVLISGDIVAAFHDRPEVREFLKYLTTADSVRHLVENGNAISPHKDAQPDWYPSEMRGIAEILMNADTVRFDASDLMPGNVGAGAFWQGMVDYVDGEDLATILATIDNAFPDLSGKVLTVLAGGDRNTANELREATNGFAQNTGHRMLIAAIPDFDLTIANLARSDQAPDLALFGNPWLLGVLANEGHTIDLGDWLDPAYLSQQYEPSWLDMATLHNQVTGVWYKAGVKSLVWYPIPEFFDAGYSVPQDWDELVAVSNQIVSDGSNPWCLGIESGAASGWVGTDWVEDIMLRTTTPANYDAWVNGSLPFSSDVVSNAFQIMAGIWFSDSYVFGGRDSINTTFYANAPTPMFDEPDPSCWLHRQANFIPIFFPEGTEVGVDVDYFLLPEIESAYGDPVLIAGDLFAAFHDRPEVRAFIEYATKAESVRYFVERGESVSTHRDIDLNWYPSEWRRMGQLVTEAGAIRFDASDLMPGEVGAGAFWQGIVDLVDGKALPIILDEIDTAWP